MSNPFHEFIIKRGHQFPFFVTLVDPVASDQPLIYVNKFFTDFTGYAEDEIIGKNCRFLQADHQQTEARAKIRAAMAQRSPVCVDLVNFKKNKEKFYNRLVLLPIRGGNPLYLGLQNIISEDQFGNFPDLSHSEILDKTINPLSILLIMEMNKQDDFDKYFSTAVKRLEEFLLRKA